MLVDALAIIGIKVNTIFVDFSTLIFDYIFGTNPWDLMMVGLAGFANPLLPYQGLIASTGALNFFGFSDPNIDQLIDELFAFGINFTDPLIIAGGLTGLLQAFQDKFFQLEAKFVDDKIISPLYSLLGNTMQFLFYNFASVSLSNVNVRQAIDLALPRSEIAIIANRILQEQGSTDVVDLTSSLIPVQNQFHNPIFDVGAALGPIEDPCTARDHLILAGFDVSPCDDHEVEDDD